MDIFSSVSSKTLPFDAHIDSNNNLGVYGDTSFSSYLNGKDHDHNFIIRKLTESSRYLKSPNTIPGSGGHQDGEIGIFGAEKYFNGGIEDEGTQRSQKLDKLIVAHMDEPLKLPKPRLGTPSVGSESSSVNSQRPLLNIVKSTTTPTATTIANNNNYSLQKRNSNNNNKIGFLSNTLGYCMCCTSNKKSAVEDVGEISFSNAVTTNPSRNNNNNYNNNVLDREAPSFRGFPTAASSLKMIHFQAPEEVVERKSLEIFGSPMMGRLRNNKPISLEKRLAMLSWDNTNNTLGSGMFYNEDEVNSDCSSDLFEIESLTKQTNPFHSPTASCYAPSEASVDWSVVTASALDFDERRPSTTSPARVVGPLPMRVNVNKEVVFVPKRRPSSILGCKSGKAVRVAEDNNKYGRKMSGKSNNCDNLLMEQRNCESLMAVKRFEDETKVRGFSFRTQGSSSQLLPLPPPPHHTVTTRSLPRPYSPRLTNITFDIQ